MLWFISKDIDSDSEFEARMEFYQQFKKQKLNREPKCENLLDSLQFPCYVFSDGYPDTRCMAVGHTNFACAVMSVIKYKLTGHWTFFVCSCLESYERFKQFCTAYRVKPGYEVYITVQESDILCENKTYLCKYLDMEDTGLGFKATKSELSLLNTGRKSLYGNLKDCFVPLENYKDMDVAI